MNNSCTEKFLKYITFDTMSDENASRVPSTSGQLEFGRNLVREMKYIGISKAQMDEYGIVYGFIPPNTNREIVPIGFIAHLDTSSDLSGNNIKAKVINNYDGSQIVLNEKLKVILDPEVFTELQKHIGDSLIVTDGTTLLGADDKAGIAEILTAAEYLIQHKEIEHGYIGIAFTPDEEIGKGTDHFNIKKFGAKYAYTVDGGSVDVLEFENFNAATARITITGNGIHPGMAKGRMKNASLIAMEFNNLLPAFDNPAYTEKYEGFNHLTAIKGGCETASMTYIIRNHAKDLFEKQKNDFEICAEFINKKYGENTLSIYIDDMYYNMKEIIEQDMEVINRVVKAANNIKLPIHFEPIRGGTDGARLTYMGLPCPNLGTGGYNFHGKYEYVSVNEMCKSVELIISIATLLDD